jgi:hypothetical protein
MGKKIEELPPSIALSVEGILLSVVARNPVRSLNIGHTLARRGEYTPQTGIQNALCPGSESM